MVLQKIRSCSRCSAVGITRVAAAAWLETARDELPRAVVRTVRVAAVVRSRTPLRIAPKNAVQVMVNSRFAGLLNQEFLKWVCSLCF
eukprot:scaffold905_cov160-Amphora_coffeaeformis.AAC.4